MLFRYCRFGPSSPPKRHFCLVKNQEISASKSLKWWDKNPENYNKTMRTIAVPLSCKLLFCISFCTPPPGTIFLSKFRTLTSSSRRARSFPPDTEATCEIHGFRREVCAVRKGAADRAWSMMQAGDQFRFRPRGEVGSKRSGNPIFTDLTVCALHNYVNCAKYKYD